MIDLRPTASALPPDESDHWRIEQETFIPLIDAETDKCVEFLRDKTWAERHLWFSNAIEESLAAVAKLSEMAKELEVGEGDTVRRMVDAAFLDLHAAIGFIIEGLGETIPPTKEAAAVFMLSASDEHRMAARREFGGTGDPLRCNLYEPGSVMMAFINLSLASRPGLSWYWQRVSQGGAAS